MVLISYEYVLFLILAFVADRVPFVEAVKEISALGTASVKTINSIAFEDREKQKILLTNAAGIFIRSLKIAGLAFLILIGGFLIATVGDELGIIKIGVLLSFLATVKGTIISLGAFGSYFLIKKIYGWARS